MSDDAKRTRILSTSEGLNREAFSAMDWTLFVSISLIWGSSFLLMAIGLDAFAPGLVTLLRVGLGAAALWLVPQARSRKIERQDWPRVVVLSVVWIAVPLTLFPVAQQFINSAVAGMLNGATPIFTAMIAVALLGRMPRVVTITGLGVGLVGVVLISAPSFSEGSSEALGAVLTAPTTRPALTIAASAAACAWPTTFGTLTGAGPSEITRSTAELSGSARRPNGDTHRVASASTRAISGIDP